MGTPATSLSRTQPIVAFEEAGLRYGDGPEILRDLRFRLMPGSFHFLTGASGAGKSSLLGLLCAAQLPTRGRLSLFGEDVAAASRGARAGLRRRIGIVFQDCRLFDHLDVAENAALALRVAGKEPRAHRKDIRDLLEWVGLGGHLAARPQELSGGQRQRLAIARAVIVRPALLLADEPTGNVDDELATRLIQLLEAMHRAGTAVVVATHNTRLAARFAHPQLRLRDGRVAGPTGSRQP
ncbi:MAG: cell division ATP-binding protein FtsE [Rhodospirillales bacterium]|jgi:cell division transport system ATP-binding protein